MSAPVPPILYAHPFSSYCQKALIALYENATAFSYRVLGPEDAAAGEAWARLWPLKRMPVLSDNGRTIVEATSIIEYLQMRHPGPVPLIPAQDDAALEARTMDRVFDNYVMTPMQTIVLDHLRPRDQRDPFGVGRAHEMLETAYGWIDGVLADRAWAAGNTFTLADCAAAPALFYADWVHEIAPSFGHLRGYRARLLARPSFARAVDEARPYRAYFPPGAPERD